MERAHTKIMVFVLMLTTKRQRAGDILWFHRGDIWARLWSIEGSSFLLLVGLARGNQHWQRRVTTVDLTKTAYRDDPVVLARNVMQVFYAWDNKTKERLKVVLEGKMKIVGVDGVTDEEDYRGNQEMLAFSPYLSLKRVTSLLMSDVIMMRTSLLDPMKIVRLLLTM